MTCYGGKNLTAIATQHMSCHSLHFIFCSRVDHPNIIHLFGVYEDAQTTKSYIVTEYMSKGSLRDLLLKEGTAMTVLDLIAM